MTLPVKSMFLQIGSRRYQVASFAQASEMFCLARDKMGEGSSNTPSPQLVDEHGKVFGYVSYNGRVWTGDLANWSNGTTTLLYCPSGEPRPYTRLRAAA